MIHSATSHFECVGNKIRSVTRHVLLCSLNVSVDRIHSATSHVWSCSSNVSCDKIHCATSHVWPCSLKVFIRRLAMYDHVV